jgi:hypothetical protein
MIMKRLLPFFLLTWLLRHLMHKAKVPSSYRLYNVENLFDTINGTNNDEEWLPRSTNF